MTEDTKFVPWVITVIKIKLPGGINVDFKLSRDRVSLTVVLSQETGRRPNVSTKLRSTDCGTDLWGHELWGRPLLPLKQALFPEQISTPCHFRETFYQDTRCK